MPKIGSYALYINCQKVKQLKYSHTQLLMIDSSELCVYGDISKDHESAIKIELSQLGQDYLSYLWFDITYPSTHKSNQPPIGGDVSINHKSSKRIELSRLGQDLFDV